MKVFFSFLLFLCLAVKSVGAEQPKRIYLALWDGCEEACRGFQDYLKSSHSNVVIIQRDAQRNLSKIQDFIAEVKLTSPDLLVTWGSLVTLEMVGSERNALLAQYIASVPTLFMVVSQPVESGLVSALVAQGRNMTGVTHLVPVSEQLQAARQFLPFKRLGIVYNPAETNAVVAVEQVKKYAPLMNFEVIDKPLALSKDGKPEAESISALITEIANKKADLIYLAPDAFMNANRQILTDTATGLGIPVFSASEGAVQNGDALFAYIHRYYNVGQLAGQKALKILNEKTPAYDIPIESPQRGLFVINMSVAQKLNIYPPMSFIQNADLVNIPKN